jgi:hypothetical protein
MISSLQNQNFAFAGYPRQMECLMTGRFPCGFSVFLTLLSSHRLHSSESVHVVCEIPESDLDFSSYLSYSPYYKASAFVQSIIRGTLNCIEYLCMRIILAFQEL